MNRNVRILDSALVMADTEFTKITRQLLQHAVADRMPAAAQCLEQLFTLRGRFPAYALLHDIVAGKLPCRENGAVYVLGEQQITPVMAQHFIEAVTQCQTFLQLPAPCILLQCKHETRDLHLTVISFPGLATMRLSTLSAGFPDALRTVQFHEVAHCFLTCGVRLLDEGFAHFFAARFAGATLPATDATLLPSMRTMLSRSADAMFGENNDSQRQVYLSACQAGTDLIEAIHSLSGTSGITNLFTAVARASSDADIIRLVEQASHQSFPAATPSKHTTAAHTALIERAREAIFTGWERNSTEDFDFVISELEAEGIFAHPALLDSLIGLQLNRALLKINAEQQVKREEVSHIDLLMKEAECLPPGRLWLWRGTRAILAICLARPNIIKVAMAGQQAIQAFDKAVQLIPHDPDLLIQHAALLLNAPSDYGGDRDLGIAKLRQAMTHPAYQQHARHVLQKYGIDEPPPVPQSVPAASTIAIAPDAPVILNVQGLRLKLSAAFTLQPSDFALKRGERLAIVGRNGSGKSILMETMLGLRQPDQGTIKLDLGCNNSPHARRQHIGGLLQGGDWPGHTKVVEIMALHRVMYQRTEAAVSRALGMEELSTKLWSQLSRGQKQRVMLWLALAHVPQIVFLDEPSLGLDEWFLRALRELWTSLPITLILISHTPLDLLSMDRVLCLNDGSIVDQGSLPDLITRHVGAYKGQIHQSLSAQAVSELQTMPGLLNTPISTERGWELYGTTGFDQTFRHFLDRHGVTAFSLGNASVEDFLAHVAQVG